MRLRFLLNDIKKLDTSSLICSMINETMPELAEGNSISICSESSSYLSESTNFKRSSRANIIKVSIFASNVSDLENGGPL